MEVATKKCSKCGQVKPITEFHKKKSAKDGLRSRCKACVKETQQRYYAANPEKLRKRNRRYREANPEKKRERQRRYNATHRAERSAYRRQRRLAYPERIKAGHAVSAAVHSGKLPRVSTQACAHCGGQATEYHHPSYAVEDRLKVIPLCYSCHKRHHSELRRQAEQTDHQHQQVEQVAATDQEPDLEAGHQQQQVEQLPAPDQGQPVSLEADQGAATDQADQVTALSGQQAVSQEADQGQPTINLNLFIQLELEL